MNPSRSPLASGLFVTAVFMALFISGAALNLMGLNYSGNDSASGLKMHPYAICTFLAVLVVFASSRRGLSRMANKSFRTPLLCALTTVTILIGRAAFMGGQSLGFLVDTILCALVVAAVASCMNDRIAERVYNLGILFVLVECTMAVFEVLTKTQFIPIDTWYGSYFRATALHGHPLNNGLILVTVSLALQECGSKRRSILIFLLATAALSAFGARGALLIFSIMNGISFIRFGLRSVSGMALVSLGLPFGIILVGWVILSGSLGDRIANVGAYDDSSNVRVHSIQILNDLDWTNILVGADPQVISRLMDRANVSVIENFLVAYVLVFGLAWTLLLLYSILLSFRAMIHKFRQSTRQRLYFIFLSFLLAAVTNNSLSTKTPALFLCLVFCWAAGVKIEKRYVLRKRAEEIAMISARFAESHAVAPVTKTRELTSWREGI